MRPTQASFIHEKAHWENSTYVIGLDEVGRGCLAGPVHVGGVCFPLSPPPQQRHLQQLGINDSKLCSPALRKRLISPIQSQAVAYHVASSSPLTINEQGIIWSIEDAAVRVVQSIVKKLPSGASYIAFTDTLPIKRFTNLKIPQISIYKGDRNSLSVAAASILAKVERDEYMEKLHEVYPQYGWKLNKGYATALHREAIREHGPCEQHRNLYLRKLLALTP